MKHINGRQLFCKACRPGKELPLALIPQVKVKEAIVEEDPTAPALWTMYLVECCAPAAPDQTFEAMLPRSEVEPSLLQAFEKGCLPRARKASSPQFKSARKAFWWKGRARLLRAEGNQVADSIPSATCGKEKDVAEKVRRRRTSGIFTAVPPCGWLADRMAIWRASLNERLDVPRVRAERYRLRQCVQIACICSSAAK